MHGNLKVRHRGGGKEPAARTKPIKRPIRSLSSLLVIVIACLFAAWIPASRAAHVDPMKTLRQE